VDIFLDDVKPLVDADGGVNPSSANAAITNVAGSQPNGLDVVAGGSRLEGSSDDVVESSSPLQSGPLDADDWFSNGSSVLQTPSATACDVVIPPALSSLPSLMQLCKSALESRACRLSSAGEEHRFKSPVSCADMFSEDDDERNISTGVDATEVASDYGVE